MASELEQHIWRPFAPQSYDFNTHVFSELLSVSGSKSKNMIQSSWRLGPEVLKKENDNGDPLRFLSLLLPLQRVCSSLGKAAGLVNSSSQSESGLGGFLRRESLYKGSAKGSGCSPLSALAGRPPHKRHWDNFF